MKKNKNSNFLFAFAGLFLLAAAILIAGCGGNNNSSNSNSAKSNSGKNNSAANTPTISSNAPPGAQPAHFKGAQNAAVTIEEFADFQCPTCALLHPTVKQLQITYGDRIKIIFRNFPLQMHPKAYEAATAAEAAGLQGKFWEMQNQLFENQQFWSSPSADHRKLFEDYAQKLGLDVEKFKNDTAGTQAKSRVDLDMQRGKAINVSSTPSFYINGKLLPYEQTNDFNKFRQVIDAELQLVQQQGGGGSGAGQTAPAATTSPVATNTVGFNSAPSPGNAGNQAATTNVNKK